MLDIITRDLWAAAVPKAESTTNHQVSHVFWMNVKKSECFTRVHCIETMKRVQRYNMTVQNQRDIRYNFMIGGDNVVYEGRGWGFAPLLPQQFFRLNSDSIIFGFMGTYESAEKLPESMFQVAKALTEYGVASDYIARDFVFHDFLKEHRSAKPLKPLENDESGSAFRNRETFHHQTLDEFIRD